MIFLRPLYSFDIDRIYEMKIDKKTLNNMYNNINTDTIIKNNIIESFYNTIHEIDTIRIGICLCENNYLIGCITLGKVNYKLFKCELNIFIDHNYQGKKLGFNSLNILIEYCKNILKFKEITLRVHKNNIKAINLYNKLKFEIKELNKDDFITMFLLL
jgi:diamine N-acetyltransferase